MLESKRINDLGSNYISPGIIDVTNVIQKCDEEVVGPFLEVTRVNSFDEAIIDANKTSYGLAAGLISEDQNLYEIFQRKIEAGIISWNTTLKASKYAPFGGIKDSGNYHPSGFFSADYCSYVTSTVEKDKIDNVTIPKGINL